MFHIFQLTVFGLVAVLAVSVSEFRSLDCPSPCNCYPEDVDCSKRNLTLLQTAMFNWRGAELVSELSLEKNQLTSLPAHIFDPLRGLKTLNLNHNQLRVLEVDVFSKLWNLKFLDMKDNQLTELPVRLFDSQERLVSLDLRNNLLTTLDFEAMVSLRSLNILAIKGNPLTCDCRLQHVVIWSAINLDSDDAECHLPSKYRGLTWYVLGSDPCDDLSATVSSSPSTESSTDADIEMSASVIDNSTEVLSSNGTRSNISHANFSSFDIITVAAVGLSCLLVLATALLFVFWYRNLKISATSSAAVRSERDKGMGNIYDDVCVDGYYECPQAVKEEGRNCVTENSVVCYVPAPQTIA
jgi:hypothetical protein